MRLALVLILCAVALPAQQVTVTPDALVLRVGDTSRVVAVLRGAPVGARISYTGTNATAFTAHRDGRITARAVGCGFSRQSYGTWTRAQVPVCVVAADTVPTPAPIPEPTPEPTPAPTPVPSGPSPVLVEDFSTYADLAQFLTNPRGIYSTLSAASEGNEVFGRDRFTLENTGYGALTKSLRFNFPDRTASGGRCQDYSIGVNLNLPAPTTEVWLEVVAQYSGNFTTRAPSTWGCTSNPDHKFIFGRSGSGRFNLDVGTGGSQWTWGYPGNEDNEFGWSASPFDGQWHTYRLHMKTSSSGSGSAAFWYDGVLTKSFTNISTTGQDIYGIAIGRNLNQGPAAPQSLTIGRVLVYTADPGWL